MKVDEKFLFNGCEIEQLKNGSTKLSMNRYIERLKPISMTPSRHRQRDQKATEQEIKQYRSLSGTLLYLRNAVLSQESLVTSLMQQKLGFLYVQHLADANNMLNDLFQLKPWIIFRSTERVDNICVVIFSDSSHTSKDKCYGQMGILQGLRIDSANKSLFNHLTGPVTNKTDSAIRPMELRLVLDLMPTILGATSRWPYQPSPVAK